MSWSLHQLMGNAYPVYYCEHCEQSFKHPADEHPAACAHCSGWYGHAPPPCEHEGHQLIPSRARE